MNHSIIKAQIYMSASWYSAKSVLFNSWSPKKIWGSTMVKHFYICFNGESLWKSFKETTSPKQFKFTCKVIFCRIKLLKSWSRSNNFACVYVKYLANMTQVSDVAPGPLVSLFQSNFTEELSDFKIPVFSLVYRGTYWYQKSTGIPMYR
jgi:hypothetical protein